MYLYKLNVHTLFSFLVLRHESIFKKISYSNIKVKIQKYGEEYKGAPRNHILSLKSDMTYSQKETLYNLAWKLITNF